MFDHETFVEDLYVTKQTFYCSWADMAEAANIHPSLLTRVVTQGRGLSVAAFLSLCHYLPLDANKYHREV
jgi:hypothetical protein